MQGAPRESAGVSFSTDQIWYRFLPSYNFAFKYHLNSCFLPSSCIATLPIFLFFLILNIVF